MNDSYSQDIRNAIECLGRGGIILYPTDTIWGIGCDATNSEAVKKIYHIKQREDSKSMLVLVDSAAALEALTDSIPEIADELLESSDEPLTIIYDDAKGVAPELIAEDGSLGIRVTNESFSKQLCKAFGKPLVSTSANVSGQKAPRFFDEISSEIKDKADYIAESRRNDLTPASPSHIIKIGKDGVFKIIR